MAAEPRVAPRAPPSGRAEWDPLGLLPQFAELRQGRSG